MLTIDITAARRFILGKQGLWPGRRQRGEAGVAAAMRAMEHLQLDPLQIVARSQDIALYSRVLDYTPGLWEQAAYRDRKFFDWGGWLSAIPMDELPHWRVVMGRERDGGPDCDVHIHHMGREHAATVDEMRTILQERGTVSNRDFEGATRTRTQSYRGRKDSSLALYYLWRTGEVMTHHRENFERIYALAAAVAPPQFLYTSDEEEADRFLLRKEVRFGGLARLNRTADAYHRGIPLSKQKEVCRALLAAGELIEVQVEGWKAVHYALGSDADLLAELSAGRVPAAWEPLETTTTDEAVFLAPLDPVSARGRARLLFAFDYAWEVYKPLPQRKYGYYTLPVLWGDRLVARFDSRFDRANGTLVILGFWPEDARLIQGAAFGEALRRGFARFMGFLGASTLQAGTLDDGLRRLIST